MSESREISVRGPGIELGVLTIADRAPWELVLELGERRFAVTGVDLFDSLTKLRRALEAEGRLICIEGARGDVYPSGMSRQMGGGRLAYRHVSGHRPDRSNLVDIFDATCCQDVVGLEDQIASVKRLRAGG
jgi:hypothetical protein